MIPVFEAPCFQVFSGAIFEFQNAAAKRAHYPTCRKDLIKDKHLVGKRQKVLRNPPKFAEISG